MDGDETTTDPPTPSGLFHGHLACSHGRVRCIGCDKRPFCVHLWTKCRCAEGEATITRWQGEPAPVLADDNDPSHLYPLKFRFVPLDLAQRAAEECTRSVLGAWVMPRHLLELHLEEPVTLAWIAPNANPAWNYSKAATNTELDAIETMLLARRGDVAATVWRVHLLAARVRRDLWDAEDGRDAGSATPEYVPLKRSHVDGLLQALVGVTRLSLDQIRQGPTREGATTPPRDDAPRTLCSDCGDLHVRPDDCPHFHECDDPDCPTCNPCSCDDPDCSQCHPLDEREVV
jgi:hypothetical protein